MHDREQEFTEFVHGSWTSLLRIATALTGDVHAAEDLLQSALVGVYTRWRRASIDSPYAYTRTALLRAYCSSRRRAWRHEIPGAERLGDGRFGDPAPDSDERAVVAAALAGLPAQQRAVLVLRFLEDLSVDDVAAILGCSAGTVRSRTSRGLASLRASGALGLAESTDRRETVGE